MTQKFTLLIFTLLAIFGIVLIALVSKDNTINRLPTTQKEDLIQVTTSFYPLYFFAQTIGGSESEVRSITPPGAEPHDFEPTAKDIARLHDSDIIILNGGNFEPWGEDIISELGGTQTRILTVGESLMTEEYTDEEGDKITDPHIWLDPVLTKQQVEKIANALADVDPIHASLYTTNAEQLKQSLDELDEKFRTGLMNCVQKTFVTSHAAFGYLAKRYALTQLPITGLSPEAEPSPQTLVEITSFVKKNKINTIFFESLVSPKLSETIAREVGATTNVLNPIEGLTGEELENKKNYFTEMETNLNNLRIALQCQ
ncbi:MAG: zinc ABC transporter substrate-binding protein [Patescibacteria group bacterium]